MPGRAVEVAACRCGMEKKCSRGGAGWRGRRACKEEISKRCLLRKRPGTRRHRPRRRKAIALRCPCFAQAQGDRTWSPVERIRSTPGGCEKNVPVFHAPSNAYALRTPRDDMSADPESRSLC